jgi:WD40 repeat protein
VQIERRLAVMKGYVTNRQYEVRHSPGRLLLSAQAIRVFLCLLFYGFFLVEFFAEGAELQAPDVQDDRPTLQLQTGHITFVGRIAFASDDHRLVSSDFNGVLKFWDTNSTSAILTVRHESLVQNPGYADLILEPAGRWLATVGFINRTVLITDAIRGSLIQALPNSEGVFKLALSPDGHLLAGRKTNGEVFVWDSRHWDTPQRFRDCETTEQTDGTDRALDETYGNKLITFVQDGRNLMAVDTQGLVEVWRTADGCLIKKFQLQPFGGYAVMSLSQDGKYAAASDFHVVRIWKTSAPTEPETLDIGTAGLRQSVFSDDSRTLALGDQAGKITLIDLATRTKSEIAVEARIMCLAFNAKGTKLAVGRFDGGIELRATSNPYPVVVELATRARLPHDIAFSPDQTMLYVATGGDVFAWQLDSGRPAAVLLDEGANAQSYFTKNGAFTWRVSSKNGIQVNSTESKDGKVENGGLIFPFPWGFLSEEGTQFAFFDGGNIAVRAIKSDRVRVVGRVRHPPFGMRFSPDGLWLAANGIDGQSEFILFDLSKAAPRSIMLGSAASFDFSRDNSRLVAGSSNGKLTVIDLRSQQQQVLSPPDGREITSVAFSQDGAYVAAGRVTGEIEIYSLQSKALEHVLKGHQGAPFSLTFKGARVLASRAQGDSVRLWDLQKGRELCALVLLKHQGWVVVSPDGRFDASDLEDASAITWRAPDDPLQLLPLEIFMRDYYEPRLLPRLLAGEKLSEIRSFTKLNRVQSKVEIMEVKSEQSSSIESQAGEVSDTVSVTVEVCGASRTFGVDGNKYTMETGVYDLRLYREGQLVGQWPPVADEATEPGSTREEELVRWRGTRRVVDAKGSQQITFSGIRLPRRVGIKEVEFSAYAFNVDRVKSETARKKFSVPQTLIARRGRAYVITVGVNTFENGRWGLKYAANDAQQMGSILKGLLTAASDSATQGKQYEEVAWVPLISDQEMKINDATKDKIHAVLEVLAGKHIDATRLHNVPDAQLLAPVNPEDLVIVALSTHGEVDSQRRFYFLPYDIGEGDQIDDAMLKRAVSSEELSTWLREVDAQDMVMIVDACHSAASVQSKEFKPGPMGDRGLGQLAYDKGIRILAATQVDQYALETKETKQGLLTYALVEDGLKKGKANFRPEDDKILLSEWLTYGAERVPTLYKDWRECEEKVRQNEGTLCKLEARAAVPLDNLLKEFLSLQQPALFDFARNRDVMISASQRP